MITDEFVPKWEADIHSRAPGYYAKLLKEKGKDHHLTNGDVSSFAVQEAGKIVEELLSFAHYVCSNVTIYHNADVINRAAELIEKYEQKMD